MLESRHMEKKLPAQRSLLRIVNLLKAVNLCPAHQHNYFIIRDRMELGR